MKTQRIVAAWLVAAAFTLAAAPTVAAYDGMSGRCRTCTGGRQHGHHHGSGCASCGLSGMNHVPWRSSQRAKAYPWHGGYASVEYGAPTALVVPPTAHLQTNWSWGTGSSRISRIDHQFGRSWPGGYGGGHGFSYAPPWPSDTYQFGVYHVRAPW